MPPTLLLAKIDFCCKVLGDWFYIGGITMRHIVVLVFIWSFWFWLSSWSKRRTEYDARMRVMESFEEDRNTIRIVRMLELRVARRIKKLEQKKQLLRQALKKKT